MRKLFFILTVAVALCADAQEPAGIDLNKKWYDVMNAIEQVESKGNASVVSRDGRYVGCLQISEILVRECNQIAGRKMFTYNDRYSREKSREMFIVFQEHHNPEGNMEKAIRLWNSGDVNCMRRKARTESYYQRVMRKYTQLAKN